MTLTPDFPEPPDGETPPDGTSGASEPKMFPDEDLSGLDYEVPADFVVPDDLSELDTLPPATHHEDPDGTQWDDPDWIAKGNSTAPPTNSLAQPGLDDPPRVAPTGFGGTPPENSLAEELENVLGEEVPHNSLADFVPAVPAPTAIDMDAELAAITGDAVELAVILTPVADAKALAAACALVGLDATAIPNPSGAVAVIKNTKGDAPEKAVLALSGLLPSFPLLLMTKANGQLNAVRYVGSQPPQEVPAGLVVAGASGVVEDLIISAVTPDAIPGAVSSVGVSRTKAMMWLSKIARHRKGK